MFGRVTVLLSVAFPVFALVGVGWIAGRFRLLGEGGSGALNGFVSWFALPAMFFASLAGTRFAEIANGPFIAAFAIVTAATFLAGMLMARLSSRAGVAHMGLHGMSAAYGNVGYMGIPLCLAAFGPQGALPGTLGAVVASVILMTLTLIFAEAGRRDDHESGGGAGRVMLALATNPLLIAIALGAAVSAAGIALPDPLRRFLDLLSAAAAPCALFAIGHFLSERALDVTLGEVGLVVIGKMLLQPLLMLAILPWFLPLDTMWGKAAVLLAALPTASNSFVLARQYGVFEAESSAAILLSTILSVFTVSILLVFLRVG